VVEFVAAQVRKGEEERGKRKRSRERTSLTNRVVWRLSAFVCTVRGKAGVRNESARNETRTWIGELREFLKVPLPYGDCFDQKKVACAAQCRFRKGVHGYQLL
jgi:hypothetical protein